MNISLQNILQGLVDKNECSPADAQALVNLEHNQPFSLFYELRALLYVGVASFLFGVGWVLKDHIHDLGHATIIGTLTTVSAVLFYLCAKKAPAYSNAETSFPHPLYDYLLYLACALTASVIAYIEAQFHWLGAAWKTYLFVSSWMLFGVAYRFDNRFVLSMALSTLATWAGLSLSGAGGWFASHAFRWTAVTYSAAVASAGWVLFQKEIKQHFLDVYLQIAALVGLTALLTGVWSRTFSWGYLFLLLAACGAIIWKSLEHKRFVYFFYAVICGYVGLSIKFLSVIRLSSTGVVFGYFIVSSVALVVGLIRLSKWMKEKA